MTRTRWYPFALFGAVATVLFTVVAIVSEQVDNRSDAVSATYFTGPDFLEAWLQWDANWYRYIVDHGYFYEPGVQSPVAFFPAYPLTMRWLADTFGGDPSAWGVLITLVSGFVVVGLFHQWCRDRIGPAATPTAVALLVLWPYAWYLTGAVYADAFFLAAVLAAFTFLERDRIFLAAIAGAIATAGRPVGAAVMLGLIVRLIERRGAVLPAGPGHRLPFVFDRHRLRRADPVLLLASVGLVSYVVYLWREFDEPFAFAEAESAQGWDQKPGVRTWFKATWVHRIIHLPGSADGYFASITFQAVLAVGLLLLVPLVVKRLGWGYGVYTTIVLLIPLVGSKDFMGLGRYALTAFPAFAVLGLLLSERPRLRVGWLVISAFLLVMLCRQFAYGHYVA